MELASVHDSQAVDVRGEPVHHSEVTFAIGKDTWKAASRAECWP
jgi:hypothetical protein